VQKKMILPVAVLGLTMLATACTPNYRSDQGMTSARDNNPNRVSYRDGAAYPYGSTYRNGFPDRYGYTNTDGFNNRAGYTNRGTIDRTYPDGRTNVTNQAPNTYGWNRYGNDFNGARDQNPNLLPTNLNADADRMANIAARVKGVDSATTFIVGKTAYVGLDINRNVNRNTDIGRVENEVLLALNKAMPKYDIRVTSDKGFFRRIGAVNTGVRKDRTNNNVDFLRRNEDHMNR